MSDDDAAEADFQVAPETPPETNEPVSTKQPESRIQRLKRKLNKLQGKDPDIYPMW